MSKYTDLLAEFAGGDVPYNRWREYDEAREDHLEGVFAAADELAEKWGDEMLAGDVGPRFGCGEIQPLLDLFAAMGREDLVARWTNGHGAGDDDEYDDHHGVYLSLDPMDRA